MQFHPEGASFLTVDVGNSAFKLVRWLLGTGGRARPASRLTLESGAAFAEPLLAWLEEPGSITGVALCSVGAPERRDALCASLRVQLSCPILAPPEFGIEVDCSEPGKVGDDRLFAARGARELVGEDALVIDAGTALTVDALGRGVFRGGAIAPGPRLLSRALAQWTALLPEVELAPDPSALGRDTRSAIRAGVAIGFAATAEELARRVAREAGIEGAPRVVTGGAREFLRPPSGGEEVLVEPDLVHVGLLVSGSAALGKCCKPVRGE